MDRVFRYLKPYYGQMTRGLIIKIAGTFADLGLPWVLAYILDDIIPYGKVSYILFWGGIMVLLAIAARMLNIIANRMASKVAKNSVQAIRHDTFERITNLSGAQVDQFTVPSLISRMTTDTYNVHQVIGMMQRLGVRAPIILVGGIVLTSTLDPVLTLILVATLPLLGLLVYLISKKGIPMYTKVQASVDKMVQTIRENISGIRVIKALSKTEYEIQRFRKVNDEVIGNEIKAASIMALSSPIMNLILNTGLAIVVIIGAFRVNAGAMQPGKIVAFLSYFTMILNAMMSITRLFINYSKASASAKRLKEVLDTKEDLIVTPVKISTEQEQEYLAFDQVSFSYENDEEKLSLKNISFQLKKGESLGIIGATGSGKTTLIQLLMRFYDVTEGQIIIEGKDIRSIPLKELRKEFGVAFQNDVIFADTISENISFGRSLSMEQIIEASKDACAYDFIMEKENGFSYEAAIKGGNLSGGQKQRLYISRALANHPKFLILDDSSSALDYKTDAMLRQAIRNNYQETTIILIAQRISSIMQSDHILVLDEGEMLGYGTHEELMEHCEIYREIYESQMGSME
ncbi:ABC transporter ATP-binding protein [Lachnoclostridium phytofermentans]|jgi:ATP-binding cassette subfamily B multidrug efflux pump|uniref:ABC transporter ATP-binding protein n=1 Tax=Lachnoclostridium phytofermentans TaxID=66219 RepID=UPI000497FF84|nr:ABC transporter ATP-binding protein [Lachnoclostridium phytofermentans]